MKRMHSCKKCGKCCITEKGKEYVIVFPSDAKRISKYLGITNKEFLNTYCQDRILKIREFQFEIKIYILKAIDGVCIFLNKNRLCSIHNEKPYQCKNTPYNFVWKKGVWNLKCINDAEEVYDEDGYVSQSELNMIKELINIGYS